MDTMRIGAFLRTHCLVGPRPALEGSPFGRSVFPEFLEGLWSGMRNLIYASARPGLEDPSILYWWSPYSHRVASSIRSLLAGIVLVVSSWSHGDSNFPGGFFPTSCSHHYLKNKVSYTQCGINIPWFNTPGSHFSQNWHGAMGDISKQKLAMMDSFRIFGGSFFHP